MPSVSCSSIPGHCVMLLSHSKTSSGECITVALPRESQTASNPSVCVSTEWAWHQIFIEHLLGMFNEAQTRQSITNKRPIPVSCKVFLVWSLLISAAAWHQPLLNSMPCRQRPQVCVLNMVRKGWSTETLIDWYSVLGPVTEELEKH